MFSNLVYFYENVCNLEQGEVPGKKKESIAGGISGGGSFFGREGVPGARYLVKNIKGLGEDLQCLEREVPNGEGVGSFLGTPRQEVYTWEKVQVLRVGGFCVQVCMEPGELEEQVQEQGAAGFRRKEPAGFLKRLTRMKKACFWKREGQEEKAIWSKVVGSVVQDTGVWSPGTG